MSLAPIPFHLTHSADTFSRHIQPNLRSRAALPRLMSSDAIEPMSDTAIAGSTANVARCNKEALCQWKRLNPWQH